MSGAVEGVARIKLDADGEAMVCTGCGTTRTVAAIVADSPTAFTCCPERKMIPARAMWHAWCDANDARPSRTTPPARSYADGVRDAAAVVDAEYDLRKHHHAANKAAGNKMEARDFETMMIAHTQSAAAIRLLSQGGKA